MNGDLYEHILRRRFGVFHEHVKVPVVVKHARIEQLIFRIASATITVRIDQIGVWISCLRIFVEVLHVRVGWRRIEIEIVFLYILAVIPLAIG